MMDGRVIWGWLGLSATTGTRDPGYFMKKTKTYSASGYHSDGSKASLRNALGGEVFLAEDESEVIKIATECHMKRHRNVPIGVTAHPCCTHVIGNDMSRGFKLRYPTGEVHSFGPCARDDDPSILVVKTHDGNGFELVIYFAEIEDKTGLNYKEGTKWAEVSRTPISSDSEVSYKVGSGVDYWFPVIRT